MAVLFTKHSFTNRLTSYFLILSTVISHGVTACPAPPPGYGLTHTELIEKTDTIVLAKAKKVSARVVIFEVIKTIKGKSEKEFFWRLSRKSKSEKHISNDFNLHNEPAFWSDSPKVKRSPLEMGSLCALTFTYEVGEIYLVFRESWGHVHSNEIINSANDKWFIFVQEQVDGNQ